MWTECRKRHEQNTAGSVPKGFGITKLLFFSFTPYFPATSQIILTPFPSHHLTYAPRQSPFRTTNVRVNRTRAGHCVVTMTDALDGGVISYNQTWVMYLDTYNDEAIRAFEIS